ncbi:hypothetical protein [Micromonospora sp. HUAS LYJ1]|uniref:hypothetical protein n=1 Tax=Micromonospora sp. HUAS LYJ1 TaxID=3061626 RepID=UPI002672D7DA|nr:hypothetical protein [Micromonospora sp. HUAS LYJ1]WKU07010.1 hypothetical protein Q2K16_08140 [Micromonospora sp. HUAS LYJ1]
MSYAELRADQWNDRSEEAAARLAREIAARHDLTVVGLRDTVYAGRPHRTALFDRGGLRFALVPGGRPTLGYDASRFHPGAGQAASYADSAEEYGLPPLTEYVDAMTSPVRDVDLPAMLVAVEAFEPGEMPVPPDDPRVGELVASLGHRGDGANTVSSADGLTVELDGTGRVIRAVLVEEFDHDEAMAALTDLGLRTTSPDEWEWACGAGATTLFRWGDDTPDDGYPVEHPTGVHRTPNLWGLAIGQDPYRYEVTTEPTVVCGGDGGVVTCGGSGYFLGWLTLATAYRDGDFGRWLASDDGYADETLTRPVIELG